MMNHNGPRAGAEKGTADPHAGHMMGGDGMMMGHDMMVKSEREFIEHMIPHHQEAVDSARETLARGATTAEVRTLLTTIIAAQEREIAEMKQWYQNWYGVPYQDNGRYQPMMRDLSALSGVAIDRAFLTDMIPHHEMAIMMARMVEPHIEHSEVRALTAAIVSSQTTEIAEMRRLLAALGS
jgi:uncharacterized protein (DUF305 family)